MSILYSGKFSCETILQIFGGLIFADTRDYAHTIVLTDNFVVDLAVTKVSTHEN